MLADGCVVEAFWDGGRARITTSAGGTGGGIQLASRLPGITADVDVWQMGSAWLPEDYHLAQDQTVIV